MRPSSDLIELTRHSSSRHFPAIALQKYACGPTCDELAALARPPKATIAAIGNATIRDSGRGDCTKVPYQPLYVSFARRRVTDSNGELRNSGQVQVAFGSGVTWCRGGIDGLCTFNEAPLKTRAEHQERWGRHKSSPGACRRTQLRECSTRFP
jgi:hypothetical protein